jgi:hypothetical protein
MMGPTRLNTIPKGMLPVYERIVGLSDNVCDTHLDSEYRDLVRAMTGELCRKRPSPLTSGQPRTWACGVVYDPISAVGPMLFQKVSEHLFCRAASFHLSGI